MKIQRIVWWVLTVACACTILTLSLQPASKSAQISAPVADWVIEQDTTIEDLPPAQQTDVKMKKHNAVRDVAHVFMYTGLSVCACMLTQTYSEKRWYLVGVPACVIFSVLDEFLQNTFAEGRVFQMGDVLRDWLGTVIGAVVVAAVLWWLVRRRRKQEAVSNGVSGSGAG